MGRLEGRSAIVTGAGSGIGRATARLFASEGARVLAADLSAEGLEETASAQEAAAGSGELLTQVTDASDSEQVAALIERAAKHFDGVDVVYANAGIGGSFEPFWEQDVGDWEAVLRVNLIGPFLALKHALPHLRKSSTASFIATASVAGLRSGAGPSPYSASKAGVISFVQTAAYQLGGSGIRVNAICPGLTETGMTQPIFDLARARGRDDRIGQLNPLGRAAQPDEIAGLALFLASDDASYVNGQAIAACGGLSASHPVMPGKLF
jgi:NAD(P)-dependent dehydrogenase (short-subunit alcohol dehydrogenase family)